MSKKLQVFISSTYTDLIEERQAAVAAVLKAGHIPAGMELFSAGDKSQLQTIRSWIDQSDAYMLILGGRYGSIEPESKLSYTELEFNYAVELGKPLFAVVISKEGLDRKVKAKGTEVMELEYGILLSEFKRKVLSNVSSFFDEPKDIRLAVFESLPELSNNKNLIGWVRGDQLINTQPLVDEVKKLSNENTTLRAKLAQLEKQVEKKSGGQSEFHDNVRILLAKKLTVPADNAEKNNAIKTDAFTLFKVCRSSFMTGILNKMGMTTLEKFLFYTVGTELATLELVEYQKVTGAVYQRCIVTSKGKQFLAQLNLSALDQPQDEEENVKAESKITEGNATISQPSASEKPAEVALTKPLRAKRTVRKKTA
ncbi:DUF4062 domain-containing protein [Janthinobacterium lividum]